MEETELFAIHTLVGVAEAAVVDEGHFLAQLKVPNLPDRILHSFFPNLTAKYNVVLFLWEFLSNIGFEYNYCLHIVVRHYLNIHTDSHNLYIFLEVVVGAQFRMLGTVHHLLWC